MDKSRDTSKSCTQLHDMEMFQIENKIYRWGDVLACAEFIGILKPLWDSAENGIITSKHAQEAKKTVDTESLQNTANQLRYELNLITAEETERWLCSRSLSLQDLNSFLIRKIWKVEYAKELEEIREKSKTSATDICQKLYPELVFENQMSVLISAYVWRVVCQTFIFSEEEPNTRALSDGRERYCKENGIDSKRLNSVIEKSHYLSEDFESHLFLDTHYRKCCEQLASPEKCGQHLKGLRAEILKIDFESVRFSSADAAKEAYLCVTIDNDTLLEIASRSGSKYSRSDVFSSEVPAELKSYLNSASPGECLQPMMDTDDDFFYLHHVVSKTEPSVDDPSVLQYLREHYMNGILTPFIDSNLQWLKWDLMHA